MSNSYNPHSRGYKQPFNNIDECEHEWFTHHVMRLGVLGADDSGPYAIAADAQCSECGYILTFRLPLKGRGEAPRPDLTYAYNEGLKQCRAGSMNGGSVLLQCLLPAGHNGPHEFPTAIAMPR